MKSLVPSLLALSLGGAACAQTFDCTISTPQSGVDATITVNMSLPGNLIGADDATTNPADTRTKPGLFGTFGATENVACPITIAGGITDHHLVSRPGGAFTLTIDPEALTADIADYAVNFIADGPEVIPVTVQFTTDAFRTRSPTSTYIAGSFGVPIGDATVSVLRAVQTGGLPGTLIEDGPNVYTFTVPLVVDLELEAELLGTPISSPGGTPTPFVFSGTVAVQPDGSAVITSVRDLTFAQMQEPNLELPATPFALPTILPPGPPANVLLNLTLQSVNVALAGTQTLSAGGTPRARCYADFNQDGGIDGADVEAFFFAWEFGSSTADVNDDGGVDGADVETFFAAWEAGSC